MSYEPRSFNCINNNSKYAGQSFVVIQVMATDWKDLHCVDLLFCQQINIRCKLTLLTSNSGIEFESGYLRF